MSLPGARRRRMVRPRARRGEGPRLRDEILDATERLIVETGDADAVSIRSVAGAVGVTPPAIYLHFADKADLLFAVCERNFALLDAAMEEAAADASDPVDGLLCRGRAYVRFGVAHPEQYRILFMNPPSASPPRSQDPEVVGGDAFAHLVEAVRRCVDAGAISGDPMLASFTVWSAVHGITSLLIAKPEFPWPPPDVFVEHVVRTQLEGLGRAGSWGEGAGSVELVDAGGRGPSVADRDAVRAQCAALLMLKRVAYEALDPCPDAG